MSRQTLIILGVVAVGGAAAWYFLGRGTRRVSRRAVPSASAVKVANSNEKTQYNPANPYTPASAAQNTSSGREDLSDLGQRLFGEAAQWAQSQRFGTT